MDGRAKKMMVVCSESGDDLETRLICDGWNIIRAYDALAAIANAQRESFDLTVLVSTGTEMDITETLFNLRDIRRSMPIVVVTDTRDDKANFPLQDLVPLSHTKILPRCAINGFISSLRETNLSHKMVATGAFDVVE